MSKEEDYYILTGKLTRELKKYSEQNKLFLKQNRIIYNDLNALRVATNRLSERLKDIEDYLNKKEKIKIDKVQEFNTDEWIAHIKLTYTQISVTDIDNAYFNGVLVRVFDIRKELAFIFGQSLLDAGVLPTKKLQKVIQEAGFSILNKNFFNKTQSPVVSRTVAIKNIALVVRNENIKVYPFKKAKDGIERPNSFNIEHFK